MRATDYDDPIEAFEEAFTRAARSEAGDHRAMTLATADAQGRPSARIVLLHGVGADGFAFYTNFGSRKATQLAANPRAALCFYWPSLDEQVRVEGSVARMPEADSDAYFASRPRDRQLGAWSSRQSEPLQSRTALESSFREQSARHGEGPISRPPFWGGFRLVPTRVEFWKHRDSRLHDRLLFTRTPDGWSTEWLYP